MASTVNPQDVYEIPVHMDRRGRIQPVSQVQLSSQSGSMQLGVHNTIVTQTPAALDTKSFFINTNGSPSVTAANKQDTAVGRGAGIALTTGSDDTLFGFNAGTALTTGVNNSAFGSQALAAATTGTNNTAVGSTALLGVTTGLQNTAVGSGALPNVTTGGTNVAVGDTTGATLTTGGNNTLLGSQSNVSAAGASFRTAVGAGVSATTDNTVQIGRSGTDDAIVGNRIFNAGTAGHLYTGTLTASGGTPQTLNTIVGRVTFTGVADMAADATTSVVINNSLVTANTVGIVAMGTTTAAAGSTPRIETVTFGAGTITIAIRNSDPATATGAGATYVFSFVLFQL